MIMHAKSMAQKIFVKEDGYALGARLTLNKSTGTGLIARD